MSFDKSLRWIIQNPTASHDAYINAMRAIAEEEGDPGWTPEGVPACPACGGEAPQINITSWDYGKVDLCDLCWNSLGGKKGVLALERLYSREKILVIARKRRAQ